MSEYAFEYETIMDRISMLEVEIHRLHNENVELTNELYVVQNRIDMIESKGEQNGTV